MCSSGRDRTCEAAAIHAYAPGGERAWSAALRGVADCATGSGYVAVRDLAVGADGALTIAGDFLGAVELGRSMVESRGADALLLVLEP